MNRVPGMFNGGIPPNLVWDENDPLPKNKCSGSTLHLPDCNGSCGVDGFYTEGQVNFENEIREWARAGMNPDGLGTTVTMWDIEVKFNALLKYLDEAGVIVMDGLNEVYLEMKTESMRHVRMANQEAAKRMKLGLPPRGLLGPDGQPI